MQRDLFNGARQQRQAALDRTIDAVRQQLGRGAIPNVTAPAREARWAVLGHGPYESGRDWDQEETHPCVECPACSWDVG